jgi:hypothetical protein
LRDSPRPSRPGGARFWIGQKRRSDVSEPSTLRARVNIAGSLPDIPALVTVDVKRGTAVLGTASAEVPLTEVTEMIRVLLEVATGHAITSMMEHLPNEHDDGTQ